jgi:pilus assembly protein CpaE
MFTARSQVDDKVEGLEAGADAYITKPARPRELFAQVNSILKRVPQRAAGSRIDSPNKGLLVGILSAKGGVGISTLAANLAIEIHKQSGKPTILSDFRPGQGTICLDLDIQNNSGMIQILEGDTGPEISTRLPEMLLEEKTGVKTLLSSYHPADAKFLTHVEHFHQIANGLNTLADYTILDLGPALTPVTVRILPECDKIIVCLEPSPANITQTKILIQDIINSGIGEGRLITVLINRQRSGVQLSKEQAENQLGRQFNLIFTPIPELAYQAAATNIPLLLKADDTMTAEQFHALARLILD